MLLTRRKALQLTSMSALVTAVSPMALAAAVHGSADKRFSDANLALYGNFSQAMFEPWVGTPFKVTSGSGMGRTLILSSVKSLTVTTPKASTQAGSAPVLKSNLRRTTSLNAMSKQVEGFTLNFRASGPAMPQDTYTLSSNYMGSFSLFLVPGTSSLLSTNYSAVFSFTPTV